MIKKSFSNGTLTYWVAIPELDETYDITDSVVNWTQVASENQSSDVGDTLVMCRYGINSSWVYGWKSGTVNWNNTTWGDPASGYAKVGQVVYDLTLTITPTPTVEYTYLILDAEPFEIDCSVEPYGSSAISGTGISKSGATVSLEAVPAYNTFTFIGFYSSDDILVSSSNPYSFTVNDNVSLIAKLSGPYNINIIYDSSQGNATYEWISGTKINLSATGNSSAQFKGWYLNSSPLSTSNPYAYTPLSDVTIEARFERVWSIDDRVDGNGAIQYTRGTDKNDVTFSVIPDANRHFTKYEVDGVEYLETPISLHLVQDILITAFFEEDDKFHIAASTTTKYASIYLSDNDVYAGTVVTMWARPFPDYIFEKWENGSTSNPRTIVVGSNTTAVATYKRISDTNGIYQYRCFVKDQMHLTDPPKAFMVVDSFDIRTDLLTKATSSIKVTDLDTSVEEGDVLVLYDPKGTPLYNGVIDSIESSSKEGDFIEYYTIGCSQMQSFYKGTWIYTVSPQTYLENEIAALLQDYADGKLLNVSYVDSLVAQRLGGITIDSVGTTTANLPTDVDENGDPNYTVYDMEDFIYELYSKYGIKFDFEINFSGPNYVHIMVPPYEAVTIGNNVYAIKDMSPITEIEEMNKLVIFASDRTYRTTYIATKDGIVEAPSDITNRFNITNTSIVFSDDDAADLVANNLPETMYNHKLTFTLVLKNFLYDFDDFKLGGPLNVYYSSKKTDEYYDTVLTGYELNKESNENISQVYFVCGLVRKKLTQLLTLGKV